VLKNKIINSLWSNWQWGYPEVAKDDYRDADEVEAVYQRMRQRQRAEVSGY
jgi:hypothetical protein